MKSDVKYSRFNVVIFEVFCFSQLFHNSCFRLLITKQKELLMEPQNTNKQN